MLTCESETVCEIASEDLQEERRHVNSGFVEENLPQAS